MGTTAEKLNAILESKEKIRQAINYKGIPVPDSTKFSEYANKIEEIETGGGLSDSDALLFIGECAEGKRKIANAVKNKYEGTSGTASEISEYSTFEELSNKIAEIPIEVQMGSAMEQNGGVLPFFDVYNETLKAMKSVGTEYKGVCAFELDKWSYDNDHKVTLSGADAYYTSDGTFIDKDFYIKENGSVLDKFELDGKDAALYQFKDTDKENTNRFVVYFFSAERYEVPKSLHATSCLNLWCVKGTPLMNFSGDFTALNSINVYDGELEVNDVNELLITNLSSLQKINLCHVKELNIKCIRLLPNLQILNLPNLSSINGSISEDIFINIPKLKRIYFNNLQTVSTGGTGVFSGFGKEAILPSLYEINGNVRLFASCSDLKKIIAPNLRYIYSSSNLIQSCNKIELISFDSLEEIASSTQTLYITSAKHIFMPKLRKTNNVIVGGSSSFEVLTLGKPVGGIIKIANTTMKNQCVITIEKGFKSTLNMGYLTGLTTECINNIIDNLAVCEGEDKDKYTITLSKSVATTEIESAITAKGYLFATLG